MGQFVDAQGHCTDFSLLELSGASAHSVLGDGLICTKPQQTLFKLAAVVDCCQHAKVSIVGVLKFRVIHLGWFRVIRVISHHLQQA
jgi:hypothetical protein